MANFPNKPIHIITSGVGSDMDILTRLIAQEISGPLGQPVEVENHPAKFLAQKTESLIKSAPDGHTLLVTPQTLWIAPLLEKTAYDPVKDFSPITLAATSPLVFFVHPSVAVNSIAELIALAKVRPGELKYISGLDGSTSHMGGALFTHMAGINIERVRHESGSVAIKEYLIAGKVHLMIPSAGLGMDYVREGKLRALAVTSAQPSGTVPGLPTVAASGLPAYEVAQMIGILAPPQTPTPIIKQLNGEIVRALNMAHVKNKLLKDGLDVVAGSHEDFANKIKLEMTRWRSVFKDQNISVSN